MPAEAGSAGRSGSDEQRLGVEVVALDGRSQRAAGYAERKVRRAISTARQPILHARVTLATAPDPAVARPARVQVTVDVNGQLVRAHAVGHTLTEAVDLLEPRLRAQLERQGDRQRTRHRRAAVTGSGGWRHGQAQAERPEGYERPAEEREVVRYKTLALDELTIDEAAFDMAMLDVDFFLFFEVPAGVDALLTRHPDGELSLRRLHPVSLAPEADVADVVLEPEAPPVLDLGEATEWLDVAGEPFVFFRNRQTGRANVLYHRLDGHYGVATPADEQTVPPPYSGARRRLRRELARLEVVRATLLREGLSEQTESESLGEAAANVQHPADLGTETFERERCQSLLEDVEGEIRDVQRAFVRLDRGTYGQCEACGRPIDDARLAAMPAARLCLEHQASAEIIRGVTA